MKRIATLAVVALAAIAVGYITVTRDTGQTTAGENDERGLRK